MIKYLTIYKTSKKQKSGVDSTKREMFLFPLVFTAVWQRIKTILDTKL